MFLNNYNLNTCKKLYSRQIPLRDSDKRKPYFEYLFVGSPPPHFTLVRSCVAISLNVKFVWNNLIDRYVAGAKCAHKICLI